MGLKMNAINIASHNISEAVHKHMNVSFYKAQLEAVQEKAKELGYFFAESDKGIDAQHPLIDSLSRALVSARIQILRPDASEEKLERDVSISMSNGNSRYLLKNMLEALESAGVRLQKEDE